MNRPIDIRKWWSEHGLWATALFCLECYWLNTRGSTLFDWLMPVSIVASAITALHLLTSPWSASRFWRPYLVKWLSWWIVNYVASTLALCVVFAIFYAWRVMDGPQPLLLGALVIPTIRFVQHALMDIQDARCERWPLVPSGRSMFE